MYICIYVMCMYVYMYVCMYIYIYIHTYIHTLKLIRLEVHAWVEQKLTTQYFALEKTTSKVCFSKHFILMVVVRLRAVFAENITLRPYGQQLLKLFLLLGQKKLGTHIVVIFQVVNTGLWKSDKNSPHDKQIPVGRQAFGVPNQGLESSLCFWFARTRLEQEDFHRHWYHIHMHITYVCVCAVCTYMLSYMHIHVYLDTYLDI